MLKTRNTFLQANDYTNQQTERKNDSSTMPWVLQNCPFSVPQAPLVHPLSLCFVHLSNDWLLSATHSCLEDNLRSLLLIYGPFNGFNSVGPGWQKQMSHSQVLCNETRICSGPQSQQILFICSGILLCKRYFWSTISFEPWRITSTSLVIYKHFLSHMPDWNRGCLYR